jgi:hypothetical protein
MLLLLRCHYQMWQMLACLPVDLGMNCIQFSGILPIRVHDPLRGLDVVYNYGTFDFDTPNFYLKFVKGDLKYFVSASSYDDFVYTYQYYNRDVFEQKLNLTATQKQKIADELSTTLISDKRFYTYKYFDRNCTTMVADVINNNIPVSISLKNKDEGKTYRKIVDEYLANSFYENLGISLIFGLPTDRPMERLFLPEQLLEGVSNTKIGSKALAQPAVTVYKSTAQPETSAWNNYYTYAAVCLLLMLASGNTLAHHSLLALFGILGLFFCTVGLYSFHIEISQNYNVLLINPLFLVLLYFIFSKNIRAIKIISYVCLGCIALYIVFTFNKPHLIIVLPLFALVITLILRALYPDWKVLPKNRNK